MLWSAGAPAGTSYEIDNSVSRDTRVTLNVSNAPFNAALDAFAQAAGLQYKISGKNYLFSGAERTGKITLNRIGDRVSWKLGSADPLEVLEQLLQAFSKRADIRPNQPPDDALASQARDYADALQKIGQLPPVEQAARTKEIRADAERYLKPPRVMSPGTGKSITTEDSQLTLTEALDILGQTAGFLWFRDGDKIVVRNSTSPDRARQIFQQARVLDLIRK